MYAKIRVALGVCFSIHWLHLLSGNHNHFVETCYITDIREQGVVE